MVYLKFLFFFFHGSYGLDFLPSLHPILFFDSIEEYSQGWTSFEIGVLLEPQPEAEILSNFWAQNAQEETALFSRIKDLESQLVHGLPPQLHEGEYEGLVRSSLISTSNIEEYRIQLALDIFDINMMQHKAMLQNKLLQLFIGQPDERFNQILSESYFEEKDIRRELYEFIEDLVEDVSYTRNEIKKLIFESRLRFFIEDVDRNGHRSALFLSFFKHFRGDV
jgi:hypothetical protein